MTAVRREQRSVQQPTRKWQAARDLLTAHYELGRKILNLVKEEKISLSQAVERLKGDGSADAAYKAHQFANTVKKPELSFYLGNNQYPPLPWSKMILLLTVRGEEDRRKLAKLMWENRWSLVELRHRVAAKLRKGSDALNPRNAGRSIRQMKPDQVWRIFRAMLQRTCKYAAQLTATYERDLKSRRKVQLQLLKSWLSMADQILANDQQAVDRTAQ